MNQIKYYNEFGKKYRSDIIASADPAVWASDMHINGPIFTEIKKRVAMQKKIIDEFFDPSISVIDLGCGFGRQVFVMLRNGFTVTGVDSSDVFISIAKEISFKHEWKPEFICSSVIDFNPSVKFNQATLFDIYEHILPSKRSIFLHHLREYICQDSCVVIISFPYVPDSFRTVLINFFKSITFRIPFFSSRKEHPYPIPSKKRFLNDISKWFRLVEFKLVSDTAFYVLHTR